jgi:two-component sensor histidine kinase
MIKRASGRPADQPVPPPGGAEEDDAAALRAEVAMLRKQIEDNERERDRAAARERALRSDLQHRVRNMLAVIRSLCSRTVRTGSAEEIRDHLRGRLDALARFEVSRSADRAGSFNLEDMARDELRAFEFDERIEIGGPEVEIADDSALLLGLALHELVTNSIKFGGLSSSDERARIALRWEIAGDALMLEWRESAVPVLAPAPHKFGFGREFIEQALPHQLGARTAFELRPGGIACTIELPLSALDGRAVPPRNWI